MRLRDTIFGGRPIGGTDEDLFHLLETVDPDRLFPHNERFRDAARARGFDVTDDFRPGEHE